METKLAAFAVRGDEPIAGTCVIGDGETFDVGKALEEGDGTIVVRSGGAIERALLAYPAVKGTNVPSGGEAIDPLEEGAAPEVKASASAKEKAATLGVDLTQVEGTGKGGAIKVEDVEAAAEGSEPNAGAGGGTADESGSDD